MALVKLPEMSENEIETVVQEENICRIAFIDGEYPYIAPFQYINLEGVLYFHFTDYGKKKEIITRNPRVCVSVERFKSDLSEYCFVSIQGQLVPVTDPEEKDKIIFLLVKTASKKYSKAFLSAHGFEIEKGWTAFTARNAQTMFKLSEERKRIGLKSITS